MVNSSLPLTLDVCVEDMPRDIVSSTLIQIPKWGSILLDAGEGSWGQLVRLFGAPNLEHTGQDVKNVETFLRDLRCLFVSHIHGDHHMGVAKILAKRRQVSLSDVIEEEDLYLMDSVVAGSAPDSAFVSSCPSGSTCLPTRVL